MRASVVAFIPVFLAALAGCTVEATVKTQKKYVGATQTKVAAADYAGEEINVGNDNGSMTVESDSSVTKITATMNPVAYADEGEENKADAEALQVQVMESFKLVEEGGKITITCGKASRSQGSSKTGLSGCQDLRVKVPAGKPIKLVARSNNGSLDANNLVAADNGVIDVRSENGSVNAVVTGSAKVSSDNGDVTVSATPTKGSSLAVETGNGDISLALPSDFAADVIAFSAGDGVKIEGFSDLTATSTSRGTKGVGATQITAKASSLGTLTVKSR